MQSKLLRAPGWRVLAGALAVLPAPVLAAGTDEIVVTGEKQGSPLPASTASIDASRIAATVNAVNVEDTLKYLPSLVVRKRHIGDTQAPLATRTSGVGASARSLIYADGALLSALIGNNNTIASPRWSIVAPEEIARVDVLYGPFSAAYPGNAIGAVVNITTRAPDRLEATATLGAGVQTFAQYGTARVLPAYQVGATLGDRFGRLALFASLDHVDSRSQPLAYVTATRSGTGGVATSGGYDDVNRAGAPIRVIGAGGFEHQRQDRAKLKAALDLGNVTLRYVGALFRGHTEARAETYLTDVAGGTPAFAGTLAIGGIAYPVAANAFANNVYAKDERHWSHSLSATGDGPIAWRVIGTSYRFDRDMQRMPTGAPPGAAQGGVGTITRLDGTGWQTVDATVGGQWAAHALRAGAHLDRFRLESDRFATASWRGGGAGAANLVARGRTRTAAVWAEDAWTLAAPLTLTLGLRQEWWRAYDGFNFSTAPVLSVAQPRLFASRLSPKGALAWTQDGWTVRGAFGVAWRFPTVGELYQAVTSGTVIAVPNPNLRPERAHSGELALERGDTSGQVRVSLFT